MDILIGVVLLLGSFFSVLAAFGILRLPDFYSRLQAATKAQTLGLVLLLTGFGLAFPEADTATKAFLVGFFVFLTSPVAAHMIARAAYLLGVPIWEGTGYDDLEGRFDRTQRTLASGEASTLEE